MRTRALAAVAAGSLILAACGAEADGSSANADTDNEASGDAAGQGLPPGATMEEYVAAFEGLDPIELEIQTLAPIADPPSEGEKQWAAAVEEWSGGVVTVEVISVGSRMGLHEMAAGMVEGRIDAGQFIPQYEPDRFPVSTAASSLGFLGEFTTAAGQLQRNGAMAELGWSEEIVNELESYGLQPLFPIFSGGNEGRLLCAGSPVTSLAQAQGTQVRVSSPQHAAEVQALGMTPVSLVIAEVYEGLQRGAVDCTLTSIAGGGQQGLQEVADAWSMGQTVDFSDSPSGIAMSKQVWDDLPLVAQQLLWDRLDVFLEQRLTGAMEENGATMARFEEAGVITEAFDDEIEQALSEHYESIAGDPSQVEALAAIDDPDALYTAAVEAHDKWGTIVEELGFEGEGTWADYHVRYPDLRVDLSEYVDRFVEEILLPRRPG